MLWNIRARVLEEEMELVENVCATSICFPVRATCFLPSKLKRMECKCLRGNSCCWPPKVIPGVALYDKFVEFAVENVGQRQELTTGNTLQDYSGETVAEDGKTTMKNHAYESEKIRMFRALVIDGGDVMQVLNMAIFPRPHYDLPIFCADFFSTPSRNVFVLDLNPLYNVEAHKPYKDKYYRELLPLAVKHTKLLPWGEKLTAESLEFFSPIVIWSRPSSSDETIEAIYLAFCDYVQAWTKLAMSAASDTDEAQVSRNQEAQHRYLTWRAAKDPGRPVLKRLLGESGCEKYIKEFLFNGLHELGAKSFVDYFPQYRCEDGRLNPARSILGKCYSERPWDEKGCFIHHSG